MKTHLIKELEIPLYSGKLVLGLSNDLKKVRKAFDKDVVGENELFASSLHCNYKGKEAFGIILNFWNTERNQVTYGVIAHEAVHIANFIMNSRGFIPDFENDEAQAYLVNWIVDELVIFIKECNFEHHIK